jgi:sulfur carrier protein
MQIQLNGESFILEEDININDFLKKLTIDKNKVAIELNKNVVPKNNYSNTVITNKDIVEIVTFIGGG